MIKKLLIKFLLFIMVLVTQSSCAFRDVRTIDWELLVSAKSAYRHMMVQDDGDIYAWREDNVFVKLSIDGNKVKETVIEDLATKHLEYNFFCEMGNAYWFVSSGFSNSAAENGILQFDFDTQAWENIVMPEMEDTLTACGMLRDKPALFYQYHLVFLDKDGESWNTVDQITTEGDEIRFRQLIEDDFGNLWALDYDNPDHGNIIDLLYRYDQTEKVWRLIRTFSPNTSFYYSGGNDLWMHVAGGKHDAVFDISHMADAEPKWVKFTHEVTKDGLIEPFYRDTHARTWLLMLDGLFLYRDDAFIHYADIPDMDILDADFVSTSGQLYISNKGGIYRFDLDNAQAP